MERNTVAIVSLLGAGLLAAVAIGVVMKGDTESKVADPVEASAAKANPKIDAKNATPRAAPGPRPVPERLPAAPYTTTASGLEYFDAVVGTGASPEDGGIVVVEYTGWLEDGPLFDSSYNRPDPFKFPLNRGMVIPGWDEGLASMKVGGKRQLRLKPELAYGERGSPPKIPPNATLIFDIELKDVMPPRKSPEAYQKLADDAFRTTASGLKIHDFSEGDGPVAVKGMMVEVEYTGWLLDGTKFDSSWDRNNGIVFPLGAGRVIKGWDEGIEGMKVGGKRQLVIPPDIAYGEKGRPPVIPPQSTLVFEVQLNAIKNAPPGIR